MTTYLRFIWLTALLIALTILCVFPAHANPAPIACALDGTGSVVFDATTNIDYYRWRGEITACTGTSDGLTLEEGRFTGRGFVATVGAHGTGTLTIIWKGGQNSQVEVIVTGIPEVLVMAGEVTAGQYAGSRITMELRCKPQDTAECFQFGSSTWEFLGSMEVLP